MIVALAIAASLIADREGWVTVPVRTVPDGAEVLVIPNQAYAYGKLARTQQCTAPCVIRLRQDIGVRILAVGPHTHGVGSGLHWVRLENGRYGIAESEIVFTMREASEITGP